jgi:hypothetical protein
MTLRLGALEYSTDRKLWFWHKRRHVSKFATANPSSGGRASVYRYYSLHGLLSDKPWKKPPSTLGELARLMHGWKN